MALSKPKATPEVVKYLHSQIKHLVPKNRQEDPVVLIGVDDYYTKIAGRNVYDSAIFVIANGEVHNFRANCDPSRYRKGIAQLVTNQAVLYKPGPHGYNRKAGPYPALRQHGNCTVLRDKVGKDTGMFYINIHRGGTATTGSAGCQTIPPEQWKEFLDLVYGELKKAGQKTVYYILVPEKAFSAAEEEVTKRAAPSTKTTEVQEPTVVQHEDKNNEPPTPNRRKAPSWWPF